MMPMMMMMMATTTMGESSQQFVARKAVEDMVTWTLLQGRIGCRGATRHNTYPEIS